MFPYQRWRAFETCPAGPRGKHQHLQGSYAGGEKRTAWAATWTWQFCTRLASDIERFVAKVKKETQINVNVTECAADSDEEEIEAVQTATATLATGPGRPVDDPWGRRQRNLTEKTLFHFQQVVEHSAARRALHTPRNTKHDLGIDAYTGKRITMGIFIDGSTFTVRDDWMKARNPHRALEQEWRQLQVRR